MKLTIALSLIIVSFVSADTKKCYPSTICYDPATVSSTCTDKDDQPFDACCPEGVTETFNPTDNSCTAKAEGETAVKGGSSYTPSKCIETSGWIDVCASNTAIAECSSDYGIGGTRTYQACCPEGVTQPFDPTGTCGVKSNGSEIDTDLDIGALEESAAAHCMIATAAMGVFSVALLAALTF